MPYGLAIVGDPAVLPPSMDGALFAATRTCVVVGVRHEADGETVLVLAPVDELEENAPPVFTATLQISIRRFTIQTVLGEVMLELPLDSDQAKVSIWINDPDEPDKVVVGVESIPDADQGKLR
jgi:hypothetical protein